MAFNLSNVGDFFLELNSKGLYLIKFKKRVRKYLSRVHVLNKTQMIRQFHVMVVQQRQ